ncbi:hypothetical protein [Aeromonas phage AS-yj]|uniref:Uncharacterized protein n=3 Tax=Ceceduovirus TaxID=2842588 RepID=A0A223LDU3_9CAUD|nr:hypothetical protein HWB28_gp338 [Aeromonas phage AS-zj]YP_009834871.1 hypothetical protein HWB29_gp169 [Aeromonas phage AS-sw]ASU00214.1 hypothetical protein [Aeromonas phage AS-zj]ATI17715.1 hypothetical protein [Aeromonas phage AS-yj]ATI18219.1 hypothetical protein [Aeromonas phage AS-sw]
MSGIKSIIENWSVGDGIIHWKNGRHSLVVFGFAPNGEPAFKFKGKSKLTSVRQIEKSIVNAYIL